MTTPCLPELVKPPDIRIGIHNLSLPIGMIAIANATDHKAYLSEIDADGLEVTPSDFSSLTSRLVFLGQRQEQLDRQALELIPEGWLGPMLDMQASEDLGQPENDEIYRQIVLGLEASPRSGTFLDQGSYKFLPLWDESIKQLRFMQLALGMTLPAVLYPMFQTKAATGGTLFSERLFQPSKEVWRWWDLTEASSSLEIDIEMTMRHRFTGIAWDTFKGQSFDDPLVLCRRMSRAGLIHAMHLSLRQSGDAIAGTDFVQQNQQADTAFLRGPEEAAKTVEGAMLLAIVRDWKWQPHHAGMQRSIYLHHPPSWIRNRALKADRARINTIRQLVATA